MMRLTAKRATVTTPSADDPRIGSRLGKYQLTGRLGSGGMGVVYAALDTVLRRPVAIKLLQGAQSNVAEANERFLREAQAAARLNHPNVVAVYDVNRTGDTYYLVMERVRGGSAQEYLAACGAFPWCEATRVVADACRGLSAAHAAGLIHRDIKPANLMRSYDHAVKLVDFGLAKFADQQGATLSAAGQLLATPRYMSPEQCRFDPLDDRSDIYSLGATYYALLVGQPPYPGDLPVQVMFAHCSQPVPDPRAMNAEIPAACAAIVGRALAKQPQQRYTSAAEMLAALEEVLTQAPPQVGTQPSTWDALLATTQAAGDDATIWPAHNRAGARRWRNTALASIALVACVVVALLANFKPWQPSDAVVATTSSNIATSTEANAPPLEPAVPILDRAALVTAAYAATRQKNLDAMRSALAQLETLDRAQPTAQPEAAAPDAAGSDAAGIVTRLRGMIEFREQLEGAGHTIALDMVPSLLVVAPQGQWLAIGGGAGDVGVQLRSLAMGELTFDYHLRHYRAGEQAAVRALAFTPDGRRLFAATQGDAGPKLLRWYLPEVHPTTPPQLPAGEQLRRFAYSADAKHWATITTTSADAAAVLKLWDADASAPRWVATEPLGEVTGLLFVGSAGDTLATAERDGAVRLWDAHTGATVARLNVSVPEPGLAASPDGSLLAVAGKRYLQLWQLEPWQLADPQRRELLQGPGGETTCAAFSPDGALLATGGGTEIGGVVTLWEVAGRRQLHTFRQHSACVRAVVFAPDGDLLISGGDDKTVRLWDIRRWTLTAEDNTVEASP